jgi:hypothetical protein
VSEAIADGARLIVLSDRGLDETHAPIPSLLLTSAVHHHLIRQKERTRVGLVVESGDAREVHHMALLVGFGAAAVNPYLVFESIEDMVRHGQITDVPARKAVRNYIKAAGKGVLKVMSKMGISTVASYTGAQVFEAIGLSQELVDEYFTGVVSRLGGVGLDVLAREVAERAHRRKRERAPDDVEISGATASRVDSAGGSHSVVGRVVARVPLRAPDAEPRPPPPAALLLQLAGAHEVAHRRLPLGALKLRREQNPRQRRGDEVGRELRPHLALASVGLEVMKLGAPALHPPRRLDERLAHLLGERHAAVHETLES